MGGLVRKWEVTQFQSINQNWGNQKVAQTSVRVHNGQGLPKLQILARYLIKETDHGRRIALHVNPLFFLPKRPGEWECQAEISGGQQEAAGSSNPAQESAQARNLLRSLPVSWSKWPH